MVASKVSKSQGPRHRWPLAEKRRIVELTLRKGAVVDAIAREQGLHATSLCHWRRLYRAGKLGAPLSSIARAGVSSATFLPVTVASAARERRVLREPAACGSGAVHVTLPSGVMLRFETGVLDAAALLALIAQLQR